jgi:hypothetical protein
LNFSSQAVVVGVVVSPAQLAGFADFEGDAQFGEVAALQRDFMRVGENEVGLAGIDLFDQFLGRDVVDLDPGQVRVLFEQAVQKLDVSSAASDLERSADQVADFFRPIDIELAIQYLVTDLVIPRAVGNRAAEIGFSPGQPRGDDVAAAE